MKRQGRVKSLKKQTNEGAEEIEGFKDNNCGLAGNPVIGQNAPLTPRAKRKGNEETPISIFATPHKETSTAPF